MASAKRICAWCGEFLGMASGDFDPRHPVTHSICVPCRDRLCAAEADLPEGLLDGLGVPVVCVDSDGRLRHANRLARNMLGQEAWEPDGERLGDVFDCVNSKGRGGCGRTPECRTCLVRKAVLHTYETGRSVLDILAYPQVESGGAPRRMRFRLSTEKAGEAVALRIDDLRGPI